MKPSESELWDAIDGPCAVEALHRFIGAGGDVDHVFLEHGWSLLHHACEQTNFPLIRALAEVGADLNIHPVDGYPPIFQALDIDIDGAIQCGDEMDFKTTRLLIELGADPDVTDNQGRTLRECAAGYGARVVAAFDASVLSLLS